MDIIYMTIGEQSAMKFSSKINIGGMHLTKSEYRLEKVYKQLYFAHIISHHVPDCIPEMAACNF
jgi:hypothetical protein